MNFTKTKTPEVLLVGIGNTGRADDGLGWKLADHLGGLSFEQLTVCYRYQLQVEDAHLVGGYPVVIFADATQEPTNGGFCWKPCIAAGHYLYSSHLQTPETVLYLTQTLFNRHPLCFTLGIEGKEWGLGEPMSSFAGFNLNRAIGFITRMLETNPSFHFPGGLNTLPGLTAGLKT